MSRLFVVTGANRGIGLSLVKELGERGHSIIATARDPTACDHVMNLKGVLSVEKLDVTDEKSVKALRKVLEEKEYRINGLINNAGIFIKRGPPPEEENYQGSIFSLSPELFNQHIQVNAMGPLLVMQQLVGILDRSEQFPVVATIGSSMGSIESLKDHRSGPYRVSKCAAHMITKLFSKEVTDCCFVNLHPGWVKTDMGSDRAPVEPTTSAEGLVSVIENLTMEKSGQFFNWKGESMAY